MRVNRVVDAGHSADTNDDWDPCTWYETHRGLWLRPTDGFWRLAGIVGMLSAIACWMTTYDYRFLTTFLPLALAAFLVPLGTKLAYRSLKTYETNVTKFVAGESTADIQAWYRFQFADYVDSNTSSRFATIYGAIAFLAFGFGGLFTGIDGIQLFIGAMILIYSSFIAGIAATSIFYLARSKVWRLGRTYHVKVRSHDTNIMRTGSTLLKVYVIGAVIWSIYSSSGVFNLSNKDCSVTGSLCPSNRIHCRFVHYCSNSIASTHEGIQEPEA